MRLFHPRLFFSAILLGLLAATAHAGETVSPKVLAQRMKAASAPLVLDVRSDAEYAEGHVPGAKLIPHDQIQQRLAELQGVPAVVLYCRSGRRAHIVGEVLQAKGIVVEYLEGDFPGWAAAGLPVERDPAQRSPQAESTR